MKSQIPVIRAVLAVVSTSSHSQNLEIGYIVKMYEKKRLGLAIKLAVVKVRFKINI